MRGEQGGECSSQPWVETNQENKVVETRSQNGIMVFREQQPAKSEVWEVS